MKKFNCADHCHNCNEQCGPSPFKEELMLSPLMLSPRKATIAQPPKLRPIETLRYHMETKELKNLLQYTKFYYKDANGKKSLSVVINDEIGVNIHEKVSKSEEDVFDLEKAVLYLLLKCKLICDRKSIDICIKKAEYQLNKFIKNKKK